MLILSSSHHWDSSTKYLCSCANEILGLKRLLEALLVLPNVAAVVVLAGFEMACHVFVVPADILVVIA